MYCSINRFLRGYLTLSVGVAGSDWKARVGAVWVGWWDSSKPRLPDRRAFVTRVGRAGESKIFGRRRWTGISQVASNYTTGTLFRRSLGKVYVRLLMLILGL
jgi:hypothetical protein